MKRRETDKLDRLLSERLKKALGDDGRADWLDVSERAGMNRAAWHWSRRRVLLLAGVLVLAVGACAGSIGVIPWLNKAPGSDAFLPPTLPICAAKNVDAKLYLQRQKANGNLTGLIVLANTGRTRCAVAGQAKVSLVGPAARKAHWRVELPGSVFSPQRNQPQTELGMTPAERKGGFSSIFLWWENWCGPGSGTNGYAGKPALRLEIANGSEFVLPIYKLPACGDVRKPSLLRVNSAAGAPFHLWKPSLPLRAEIVGIEKGAPFRLKSGRVFRYRVALTNTSSSTFRFRDCPLYQERALQTGDRSAFPLAYGIYVLNCRSVGEIEAGKTVTFAMELPVPKTGYSTKGVLTWVLAFDTKNPPTAKAPIAVEGVHYLPAAEYSVFAPGKPEATFPPRLRTEAGFMQRAVGPIVKGSRRILLENPGSVSTIMYAFVTESGRVCFGLLNVSSCDGGASQTAPLVWVATGPYRGGPRIIAGLVKNGVKSIAVIVNAKPWPTKLANNAFYVEVPLKNGHRITAIVATMNDGSQRRIGIGPLG